MGSPSYKLLILQGERWSAVVEQTAQDLGIAVHHASDVTSAHRALASAHAALVLGYPQHGPMQLRQSERVDIAMVGPAGSDAMQEAFDAGAIDWLVDPQDHLAALRILAGHSHHVARRRYQHDMLDALARALQHHLQPARIGQTGVARVVLHEVRNALASLELNVGALAHDLTQADPETQETLDDLAELTQHLGAVVGSGRTLLGDSKDGGDVGRAIRAAVTMTGTRSASEVLVQIEPELGPVVLPTHQLAQILLNTTLNALHAGAVRVSIDAIRLPTHVHIAITDDGAGMTATDLSHSLERGYSTKESGTGLGLAICKEILDAAGGSIRLASQFGSGTTVVLTVPFLTED